MDPMDQPPADHGSDRYDYIEIDAPAGITAPDWLLQILTTDDVCPDCRANMFMSYRPVVTLEKVDPADIALNWHITVAHDETCPSLARMERGNK